MQHDKHKNIEIFSKRLRQEIKAQGLNITQFAKLIGKPRVTVYSWLNGDNVMSLDNYYKVLDALGLKEPVPVSRETKN